MSMFRHKQIAHFRVADFEFKNHVLKILEKDGKSVEERVEEFRKHCQGLRRIDQNNIVEVNEAALAALEKPMGSSRVIKGADNSAANKTPSTSGIQRPVGLTEEQEKHKAALESSAEAIRKERQELEDAKAAFAKMQAEAAAVADESKKNEPVPPATPPAPEPTPPATPPSKPAPTPAAGGLKLPNDPIPAGKK